MSKNLNISISNAEGDLLFTIQQELSKFRKARGSTRNANQTDAIKWIISHVPMPTTQTATEDA